MSGGAFDYRESALKDIAIEIEEIIENNDSTEKDDFGEDIGEHFSEEVISELEKGVQILKEAYIYMHRIDYLLEGDDDEGSFLDRLIEDRLGF